MKLRALSAALAIGVAVAGPARAQSATDKALAEALFQDAKKLMADGRISEACGKFAESQRLDGTPGTLLNLAVCHEAEGKTASAWAEFASAATLAARAGQAEREQFARDRHDALEKRLSRVVITADAVLPGFEVRLNGEVLRAAVLGSSVPVDPGTYELQASAPGKLRWTYRVSIGPGPSSTSIRIPALVDEVAAAPAPVAAPSPARAPEPARPRPKPVHERDEGMSGRAIGGWVAMGFGATGTIVGTVYGLRTLSKKSAGDERCTGSLCDATGLKLQEDAHSAATVSTVAFGVGLVGLGVGTWLLLTDGGSEQSASRSRLVAAPAIAPGVAAVSLSGRW